MNDFDLYGNRYYYSELIIIFALSGLVGAVVGLGANIYPLGCFLLTGGLSLIVEHLVRWKYLTFELIGHETWGLISAIAGLILIRRKKK